MVQPIIGGETPNPPADATSHHLFRPTPAGSLREMSTDRPDKTESPYTLDAGHFQLEMDLVNYTHDHDRSRGADAQMDAFAFGPVNLKVGLLDRVDFQLVLETYNYVRVDDRRSRTVEKMEGFGDVTTRLKVNFWGNNGGRTALGAIPFVKLPSNQDGLGNNGVEGGIIFPLAVGLPRGWAMGVMTELDLLRNDANHGHHATFIHSITFEHRLYGKLEGYAEFYSEVSAEREARWIGTADFGMTYKVTDNLQLDAGINIGVTESADDLNPFVGVSWRF